MIRYAFLLLPLSLASCGVIDDLLDTAELVDRADDLEEFVDLSEDIDTVLNGGTVSSVTLLTEEDVAERQGTVDYSGYAGLLVPDGNDDIAITAEALITADFDDQSVTAEFDDWLGIRLDQNGDNIGLGGDANGDVDFTNGTFELNGGDISFIGDIDGELTFKGDVFTVTGPVEGSIGETSDGESIAAGDAGDLEITLNGEVVEDAQFGFGGTE